MELLSKAPSNIHRLQHLEHLVAGSKLLEGDQVEKLTRLPKLKTLTLNRAAPTEAHLKQLAAISSLKRLTLSQAPQEITGLESFQKQRPDVKLNVY